MYAMDSGQFCVFHFIILLFMDTVACQQDLKRHSVQATWKNSFKECRQFGGSDLFQECEANTCNASSAKGQVNGLSVGLIQEYWVNGFLQRSPVVKYKGCYYVNGTIGEDVKEVVVNPEERTNTINYCASQISSLTRSNYIYMKILEEENKNTSLKVQCSIVTDLKGKRANYVNCDRQCGDNYSTMCGGLKIDNTSAFFSIYEVLALNLSSPLGKTCHKSIRTEQGRKVKTAFCNETLGSACDRYSSGRPYVDCTDEKQSWFDAQKTCLEDKKHLIQNITASCMKDDVDYWIGQFAIETVSWNNEHVPSNAYCLKLVLSKLDHDEHTYTLQLEDCYRTLYPLCAAEDESKVVRPQDNITTTNYSAVTQTVTDGLNDEQTKIRDNKDTSGSSTTNEIGGIVGGVFGGVVVLVVAVVIVILCKRQRELPAKRPAAEIPMQSLSYPEPETQNDDTNLPEYEGHELLDTHDEGVYNHLGEGEPMKKTSSLDALYDRTGHVENEYDVSQTCAKHDRDNAIYDSSTTSGGVYSTTADRKLLTKAGTGTYDL